MVNVSVLWEINRCPVPRGYDPRLVGPRIVSALKDACFTGPVTITAFGNLEDTAGDVLRDIYSTGIALKHIPCDGFLTETDLFEWTRNNPIPACLMLICGPAQLERLARTLYDMGGYVIVLAYPRRKRSLDWLWKSFLTVVNTKWLWETFLEGSADNKQEVLEEKCSEAGESDWFCTLCDFAGQRFENFTLHLNSEDHAMKEPEPPKTPPVKSQPKKTAVYWHINSCPVPPGYPPRQVRPRIVSALKNSGYSGPLTITAVGNLEQTPDKLLQDLSFTGIALRHVHRGIQNALFEWKSCNPPPATLMLICSHQQLESLSRTLYYIHNRGYTILLAYPERPQGSDWLWKSFLSVASKDWLWHNLLEVDNKPRTGRHVLREKCCETGDWFCTVCDFAGGSFRNFITHLNSEEHAQEESGMVPRPVKKPLPLNTTPDNSSQAKPKTLKKTSVLWDINSCPVPCGYYPRLVGLRIVSALENSGYSGPFTITAVGNLEHTPDKLLQELSSTGIALRHDLCDFQTDMFAWVLENPPPATLMLICDHEQLELLSRSVYEIHPRGYTILLAYPQLAHGSDSLLKNFLTVSSKEWLWETLLEDSGPVVNKRMRRQVLLQENCSETGDTFCRVCDFAGESFKSFITHLKSKEHAQEELGLVYLPLKKTPSTSTMVKSPQFRSIRHHFDLLTFVEAKTLKKNGKKMEIELVVEEEEHRISIQRKT